MNAKKSPVRVQDAFEGFMEEVSSSEKADFNVPACEMQMSGLDINWVGNPEPIPTTPEFRKQMN